ncbi:MAG: NnrU protein, partial [Deltaproteobacteria bacterium]|nr:NnrU protein [Deltaproteobacteria bacterium]
FNGDLGSVIFFGTFLVLALLGPASIDRKRKRIYGADWDRFAAVTSNVPFLAIAQGRNSLMIGELGWWRIILVVAVYGFFLHMHQVLFGVSPLPM